jgi:hypothetical protein
MKVVDLQSHTRNAVIAERNSNPMGQEGFSALDNACYPAGDLNTEKNESFFLEG